MKFNIINYSGGSSGYNTGQQLVRIPSYDEELDTEEIYKCLNEGAGKIDFGFNQNGEKITFTKKKTTYHWLLDKRS